MQIGTETSGTKRASRWRLWLTNVLAAVGLLLGFAACDTDTGCGLGEEVFDRQNPGAGEDDEWEQEHSAGQTGQREDTLMIDEDAGDTGDTGDAQNGEAGEREEPVPDDPGALPR